MSEQNKEDSGSAAGQAAPRPVPIDPAHELQAPPETHLLSAPDDGGRAKRRHRYIWIGIILALLLVLLLIHECSGTKPAPAGKSGKNAAQGPAAITTGQSRTGDINIYLDALGTVTPINTVSIYSQITGRVMAVHFTEGQLVRKGDPLIDIDPRPSEATLQQAEGNLKHDQGVLAEARIDLQRYKDAFARNAIAKQQLDDQEQAVVQDEGSVQADEGTVQYDQVQLAYCHIVSPINGQVGLRLVDPGNTVFSGSGSTLAVITQLQPMTVVFNVSEDDLSQVQTQLRAGHKLEVDAFDRADDKKLETGALTSLDNEVDTLTGTIKFRAQFPNNNRELFPNQFVNARLLVTTLRNTTLVSSAAIQHNGTQAFVYIVKPDNTVAVQAVTAQASDANDTAVTGLNAGVNVATSGFDRLENGVHVTVRPQAEKPKDQNSSTNSTTTPTSPSKGPSSKGNTSSSSSAAGTSTP